MGNDKHLAELEKLSENLSSKFKSAEDRLEELSEQHKRLTDNSSGKRQQNDM